MSSSWIYNVDGEAHLPDRGVIIHSKASKPSPPPVPRPLLIVDLNVSRTTRRNG